MKLSELLSVEELVNDIVTNRILARRHPQLPLIILNYSKECMFDNYWSDSVQKCRGLVVDTTEWDKGNIPDSQIVSRPFRKFFGLNWEGMEEYQEANLPKVDPVVTEKMDGWFGILWRSPKYESPLSMVPNWDPENKCHWGIASRGSFESPGALFASGKLGKFIKYGAINEFPEGYTPIFEIIFKEGRIVVDYPFEGLVLLGLVNNETGEELPYDDLQAVWAKIAGYATDDRPWIRLVKAHHMSLQECVTTPKKNFEGYVLSYPRPGTWPIKVKVKLDEYKRLHKLITGVTPQQVWNSLQDPMAKWLLEQPNIPKGFRTWASDWRTTLMGSFHEILEQAIQATNFYRDSYEGEVKRAVVVEGLNKRYPKVGTIALQLLDGKIYEAYQSIWNRVRPVGRETEAFYREGDKE